MLYPKIDTLFEHDEKTFKIKVEPGQDINPYLKNPIFGLIKEWEWTEKVDGSNILSGAQTKGSFI